jgi:hypothetical protein
MKPMLITPVTEGLKLQYDKPPSKFSFKSNLRRYIKAEGAVSQPPSPPREAPSPPPPLPPPTSLSSDAELAVADASRLRSEELIEELQEKGAALSKSKVGLDFCFNLLTKGTFIELQGTHMVSINQTTLIPKP